MGASTLTLSGLFFDEKNYSRTDKEIVAKKFSHCQTVIFQVLLLGIHC